jgi:hypothetical protein
MYNNLKDTINCLKLQNNYLYLVHQTALTNELVLAQMTKYIDYTVNLNASVYTTNSFKQLCFLTIDTSANITTNNKLILVSKIRKTPYINIDKYIDTSVYETYTKITPYLIQKYEYLLKNRQTLFEKFKRLYKRHEYEVMEYYGQVLLLIYNSL